MLDSLLLLRRRLELAQGEEAGRVRFKLGQVIQHKRYDYRGVIIGMDPSCQADERWIRAMGVQRLPHGAHQPFYNVLVDERDRPGGQSTYVAHVCQGLPKQEERMRIRRTLHDCCSM